MKRKGNAANLPSPADRIWLVEQHWDDGQTSQIVMTHEELAREAEEQGWRVTEYIQSFGRYL